MVLPKPEPGMVLGYAYLWRHEFLRGQEEGRKDRPCVIILAVENSDGYTVVTVAPITHTPPQDVSAAIEIPVPIKTRLSLDEHRSWIVVDDLNRFVWPGVDLRPTRRGGKKYVFGFLPANLFFDVRNLVAALAKERRVRMTSRDN